MTEFEDRLDTIALEHVVSFINGNREYVIRAIAKLPPAAAVAVSARVTLGLPPYLQGDFVRLTMHYAEN